jgi:non-ribosomal peptide synthetase component E (peptide arylation enzyme)
VRVDQAMKVWKKEFHLADIPERDNYQLSCPGRHTEVSGFVISVFQLNIMPVLIFDSVAQNYIFAGAIVPILDKFMKASGYHGGEKEKRLFHVVRVDTSAEADNDNNAAAQTGVSDNNEESDDELEISQPSSKHLSIVVEHLVGGEEDIGKGVARKMSDRIGASIFRGQITKVRNMMLLG